MSSNLSQNIWYSRRLALSYANLSQQKRDSSIEIDTDKGPGVHEVLEEATTKEVEICETPQNEGRLGKCSAVAFEDEEEGATDGEDVERQQGGESTNGATARNNTTKGIAKRRQQQHRRERDQIKRRDATERGDAHGEDGEGREEKESAVAATTRSDSARAIGRRRQKHARKGRDKAKQAEEAEATTAKVHVQQEILDACPTYVQS
jgi:hypothetical protein